VNVDEARYGSWRSPITPAALATYRGFGGVRLHAGHAYWREATDGGRNVICRRGLAGGPVEVLTPEADVRSRVHEYGGGDFTVGRHNVYYVEDSDQQIYRQALDGRQPRRITVAAPDGERWRYADLEVDEARGVLLAVRERHRPGSGTPDNDLVLVGPDGRPTPIAGGHDFVAAPRISADGGWLCWLSWDLPAMPWDHTRLWVAPLADPAAAVPAAGGADESVLQPEFGPDGMLYFMSDRSGYWNLYRLAPGTRPAVERVTDLPYDCAVPPWEIGTRTYGFLGPTRVAFGYHRDGRDRLAITDLCGRYVDVDTALTDLGVTMATGPDVVVCVAATAHRPAAATLVDLSDPGRPRLTTLRAGTDAPPPVDVVSEPAYVAFETADRTTGHAILNLPRNGAYRPRGDERPPLVVTVHGGPTSHVSAAFLPAVQYWTSRGFAHLTVNYAGSSGYGRAYRKRLDGAWGVADVEDVLAACRHLAARGVVDEKRIAVRGGSAGGYTALSALAFTDYFAAGASYYGVTDLELLAAGTHKFESHYLDGLVGPLPEAAHTYRDRSPRYAAGRITVPVALFAVADDPVVPLSQAVEMSRSLSARGVEHVFRVFGGGDHGFRTAANLAEAIASETEMYAAAFGLTPAPSPPLERCDP
jgi:dipeptidyl aminopeptidase/acylaminoacyl peptidase